MYIVCACLYSIGIHHDTYLHMMLASCNLRLTSVKKKRKDPKKILSSWKWKESQNIIEASPERQANIRLVLPLRLCLELIHQVNILFPRCLPPLYYRYCQTISHCHPIFLLFLLPKNSLLCCREQQLHKSDDEKISATLAISSPSSSVDDLPVGLAVQRRAFTFPNLKNLAGRTRTVSERAEEKDQVFYRLGYVLLIWESQRWER